FAASRVRSHQNASDLVQEVYFQIVRFPPPLPIRDPRAYLFRIAWHICNQFNRRAKRDPVKFDSEAAQAASESAQPWIADASDELTFFEQFETVLRQLPEPVQAALLLCKRDGLSHKEAARRLGVSVHTIHKYIGRALVHFRKGRAP